MPRQRRKQPRIFRSENGKVEGAQHGLRGWLQGIRHLMLFAVDIRKHATGAFGKLCIMAFRPVDDRHQTGHGPFIETAFCRRQAVTNTRGTRSTTREVR